MTNRYPNESKWITRRVNLDPKTYDTVKLAARDRGLGERGFSKALRQIIREWDVLKRRFNRYPLNLD
ncbi:MAG: hypothetical protein PVG32_17985 [Anaerolineales bacterium]